MYKLASVRLFAIVLVLCFGIGAVTSCRDDSPTECIVFTPNGNGINDVFEVTSADFELENGDEISLKIYTRTGILVFSIEAVRCRWDGYSIGGQEMAPGIYFYTVETVESKPKPLSNGLLCLYR